MTDQRSLAIGRNGQNVRLASKLIGWEIDVLDFIAGETAGEMVVEEGEEQDNEAQRHKDAEEVVEKKVEEVVEPAKEEVVKEVEEVKEEKVKEISLYKLV